MRLLVLGFIFWMAEYLQKKKERLEKLKRLRDFEIEFYDMTKYDWSMFPNNREHVTLATYYRLRIPEILPENIKKVLYLDGDVIVEQDLKKLWDTDISNYVLGAVKEGIELGVQHDFNAGVLLLNLSKLQKINLLKESLSYLEKNKEKIVYQDQDILNGLFFNQYKDLPRKWNVTSNIYMSEDLSLVYANKEAEIARKNPGIIHFSGHSPKPWYWGWMPHPLSNEYWKYLKYTDFYSSAHKEFIFAKRIRLYVNKFLTNN
ncbi:MAG: glycosyltransferase family 8 protein [Alphaproteobacteria bacterium]|nr:glycosyltransferase family 8 protein [Alphaproteobacteria bacterium]